MSGKFRSQEELPGDFEFKVIDQSVHESNADDSLSLGVSLGILGVALLVFAGLFFSTFSLHAKMHLFILATWIGIWVYNHRVYNSQDPGYSYLDSYRAYSFDSESGVTTELGRFGKWRRLIWSLGEPPNPDFHEAGEEPSRSSASIRTLVEWSLIGFGIIWSVYDFGRYYFASDGPYFHDIWGHYMIVLALGAMFWCGLWLKHRLGGEWEDLRAHVESLNFFVCRWLMGYLLIWCGIGILWLVDQ